MKSTATVMALCPWQGTTDEMGEIVQMGETLQMNQNTGSTDIAKPAAGHGDTCADVCIVQRMSQCVLKLDR